MKKEKPRLNAKAAHFRQIKNNVLTRRAKLTEKLRAEETQYADELKTAKNSHKEADLEALTRRFGFETNYLDQLLKFFNSVFVHWNLFGNLDSSNFRKIKLDRCFKPKTKSRRN